MGSEEEEAKSMMTGTETVVRMEGYDEELTKKKEEKVEGGEGVLTTTTTHFVLVHGVGGGGWCWYKIKCLMESSGYKVSCIDLRGAGIDPADPNSILSFHDYNQPLLLFLSSLPLHHQVILVGHSAGGLSVTDATHKFGSSKIRLAVYVAATMLKTGFSSLQDLKDGVPDLSEFGDAYDAGFGLGADQPPTSLVVKKELQRKIIYQMSPLEDSTLAAMLLRPGPVVALQSAQFLAEEGINKVDEVPRVYIKTLYDNVVKPEQQDAMIKKWPPSKVFVLESDHSPFFSSPFVLFGLLVKLAAAAATSSIDRVDC